MDHKKIIQNSHDSIRKIISFIYQEDSQADTRVQVDIFQTNPGKLFAKQVEQIVSFVIRGLSHTIIPAAYSSVKEMIPRFLEDYFSDLMKKQTGKQIDSAILSKEAREMMASRLDQKVVTEGFQSFPSGEDRPYYFSFTILALFAYLDVYSSDLLKTIIKNKKLSEILRKYLNHQLGIKATDAHDIVDVIKKLRGIKEKLYAIDSAFSISEIFSSIETQKKVEMYREGLKKFIRIRGKIAHSNPKLNHEEYTYEDLESDLNDFEISFKDVEQFVERIGFSQYGLDEIKSETSDIAQITKKVRLALIMAIIYPAIIDVVIHEYLS
jgi:hypothetical protein